jgi:hypothetical protein
MPTVMPVVVPGKHARRGGQESADQESRRHLLPSPAVEIKRPNA